MINLKSYLISGTSKDSMILLVGSILSTGLGLLTIFLLTKNLSLYEFGLLISSLTFVQLSTDLFELGINQATLNFLSGKQILHERYFILNAFILKLSVAFTAGIFIYLERGLISDFIFDNNKMSPFIAFAAIGICTGIIFNWIQSLLQSQRYFITSILATLSINILRVFGLILVFNVFVLQGKDVFLLMQTVVLIPILTIFLLNFRYLTRNYGNLKKYFDKNEMLKIIKFGLPLGAAFAISALYTRLDQIMILKLTNPNEAAIYGLASRITLPLLLVVSSISTAIIPRYVSIDEKDFSVYFKKSIVAVGLVSAFVGVGIILLPFLLPWVFGRMYLPSVITAQILLTGMIFFILSSPFYNLIVYRLKSIYYSLWLASGSLILVVILLNLLIPYYKSQGAAISIAIVYFSQFLFSLIYLSIRLRKHEGKKSIQRSR